MHVEFTDLEIPELRALLDRALNTWENPPGWVWELSHRVDSALGLAPTKQPYNSGLNHPKGMPHDNGFFTIDPLRPRCDHQDGPGAVAYRLLVGWSDAETIRRMQPGLRGTAEQRLLQHAPDQEAGGDGSDRLLHEGPQGADGQQLVVDLCGDDEGGPGSG